MIDRQHAALIIVDVQNDFCPGGSLAVPDADKIIPIINSLQAHFDIIIATIDWHPGDHLSFASNNLHGEIGDTVLLNNYEQVLWPVHCVQNTEGAKLRADLDLTAVTRYVYKGMDKNIDSYSAFFDNQHLRATELSDYLKEHHVHTVYLVGLATNFCVRYTCQDAIELGFKTYVIDDACGGIELKPGAVKTSLEEMEALGAHIIKSHELLAPKISEEYEP